MVDYLAFLTDSLADPLTYLTIFFIYCVLAAVILPIPVELGLAGFIPFIQEGGEFLGFTEIFPAFLIVSIVMGLGKAVGSWMVFMIGEKAENSIRTWFRWRWFVGLTEFLTKFCEKLGYIGVFLVLALPMMTDTIPLYIFSLLNKDGEVYEMKWFVLTNFWAGLARGLIVGISVMYTVNNMEMNLESLILISALIGGVILAIILYFSRKKKVEDEKGEGLSFDDDLEEVIDDIMTDDEDEGGQDKGVSIDSSDLDESVKPKFDRNK